MPFLGRQGRSERAPTPQMRRRHQENLKVHGSVVCLAEGGRKGEADGSARQVVGS